MERGDDGERDGPDALDVEQPISRRRVSNDSLATIKVYRLVSVYFQILRGQWSGTEVPHGWWVISMPDDDASEGNERMNRDTSKRPQSVVLGVKRLDSSGVSPQQPHPAVRSTGSLAGRECKGCPAPHRDSETPRLTRTGRFRAVLVPAFLPLNRVLQSSSTVGLVLLRILSAPALWLLCKWRRRSREYRDRRLLANWSDAMLRDVGLWREEVDRSFWRR